MQKNIERQFVPKLMANSWGYVRTIIEVAGVGIIIFVSIILLVNDFDKLKEKASHSIGYRHFVKILKRIFHMGGMFLKAQLIIMSVIAALCTVTFLLLKNPYALLLGVLIGFLDALPVLGTAVVLYPLAIVQAFQGRFLFAFWFKDCIRHCCHVSQPFCTGKNIPHDASSDHRAASRTDICYFLPAIGTAILFNIGASSGGTDIIAMIMKKHTSMNIGTVLMLVDVASVLASFFIFDAETGLVFHHRPCSKIPL